MEGGGEVGRIEEFYRGKEILLTGATGFLGKVLLEKLLRTCPISRIYLLVRTKKGVTPQQRIQEMFESPLFRRMKAEVSGWEKKVVAVGGDCEVPGLGLSLEDKAGIISTVSVILHSAATVRFDEPLPTAVAVNIDGTKHLVQLAKEMPNLKALVHVSTAYSNCVRETVEEKVYPASLPYSSLDKLIEAVDNSLLDKITPVVLGDWPNTYVFTKQVAEELVATVGQGLPVAIFRPSIVVCSEREPMPGWSDTMFGASGIMVGTGTGLLRVLQCDTSKISDIVPVDMAVNAIIAVAWKTATMFESSNKEKREPVVYNYVSGVDNPLRWGEFRELGVKHAMGAPPLQALWFISLSMHSSHTLYALKVFLLHFLPALLIDTIAALFGKNPNILKIQKKIRRFSDVLVYFLTKEWHFKTSNVQNLWKEMSNIDKEMFPFNIAAVNWDTFFQNYTRGLRHYAIKDDPSTIPKAKQKMRRFYWMHQALKIATFYCLMRLSWMIISPIGSYLIEQF